MNRIARRWMATAVGITAGLTAVLATAQPASALPNPRSGCPSGDACVWKDIHYYTAGTVADSYRFVYYQAHFGSVHYSGTGYVVGDSASSAFNNGTGGERAYFFKDASCSGTRFYLSAGTGDSDFTNGSPAGNLNDQLSSGAFSSQLGGCYSA